MAAPAPSAWLDGVDRAEARDAVETAIHGWNDTNAKAKQTVCLPWRWEISAVPERDAIGPVATQRMGAHVERRELLNRRDVASLADANRCDHPLDATAWADAGGVPGGTALRHAAVFGMTDVVDPLVAAGARTGSLAA
ncbi:hypothetical protein ACPZ19_43680 [Amycolatopsis lurida]